MEEEMKALNKKGTREILIVFVYVLFFCFWKQFCGIVLKTVLAVLYVFISFHIIYQTAINEAANLHVFEQFWEQKFKEHSKLVLYLKKKTTFRVVFLKIEK